ncbi:hypothetical protein, partial [uncultured Eudoraea sp.]|uniref:hypothetical protein n=1 Tax=uncultured Eudoraea sp. TaxID=1035614 RepID=UPI00261B55B0
MMIIMGVNLKNKFLVGDYSKKLLKGISFLGLFLLLVMNGFGQSVTVGFSTANSSDDEDIGGNLPTLLVTGTVSSATTVTLS